MKIYKYGALILLVSVMMSCAEQETTHERPVNSTPVKTAVARAARLAQPVHSSGLLSAKKEMRLSFNIPGMVAKVNVDEGQTVKAGTVLAELNLSEIRARYNQAKSGLEKAQRDVQRVENLYADSVATLEQKQNAETGRTVAKAEFEVAAYHLRHARILAPSDGKVLRRFAEMNEMLGAGTPVFLFAGEEESWTVRCGVSETELLRLQTGDSAAVHFDAHPNQVFSGVVSEVAGALNPRSGTFEIEVVVPRGKTRLASGFMARVDIRPSKVRDMVLIPAESLVEAEQNHGFIFLLNSGKANKQPVRIGHIDGAEIALTDGVAAGATVITDGAAYLVDGADVTVVNE